MEEVLISFETAKLAKEKEFNEHCTYFYTKPRCKVFGVDEKGRCFPSVNKKGKLYKLGKFVVTSEKNAIVAPTQSLLQKWLRENHKILVESKPVDCWGEWITQVWAEDLMAPFYKVFEITEGYPTYEQALERGLFEGLKLIP